MIDVLTIMFAVWTVVFHVGFALRTPRDLIIALWLVATIGVVAVFVRRTRAPAVETEPTTRGAEPTPWRHARWFVLGGIVAALLPLQWGRLLGVEWWVYWAVVVAVTAAGVALTLRQPPRSTGTGSTVRAATGVVLVLIVASAFAVASVVVHRPDADDAFLVNRSAVVEEGPGPIPTRDTLFSDEAYPITRSATPSPSIEAFIGVLGRLTPISAQSVTYLVIGPLAAALGIFALWRLLRAVGALAPALATAASAAFLTFDGGGNASLGNFAFGRSWQGKVILLLVVVPLLWRHALRFGEERRPVDGWLLFAANIAAVGLSTTAALVGPFITVVGTAAGALGVGLPSRETLRRVGWALAAAAYPIGAGLMRAFVFQRNAADLGLDLGFRGRSPGGPLHIVLGDHGTLIVATTAMLLGWLWVRRRGGRLLFAGSVLATFAIFYSPRALDLLEYVTGAGAILWRTAWLIPITAMIGVLAVGPAAVARGTRRVLLAVAVPLLMAIALSHGGLTPIWSASNHAWVGAPGWDVYPSNRHAAERLAAMAEPGETVGASQDIGVAMSILATGVYPINTRTHSARSLRDVPEFRAGERIFVSQALRDGLNPIHRQRFVGILDHFDVRIACSSPRLRGSPVTAALSDAGFRPVDEDGTCTYWQR